MNCFACCGTGNNEIEEANELSQKQELEAEKETMANQTPSTKPPKRMSVKASLRASVKELLLMKTKFSFANISFKSDSSKHRYISDEVAKFGKGNISARIFTYEELCELTKNFSSEKLLGEGGFGKVYKGFLTDMNKAVAIKQLDRKGCQGNKEFLVEVLMLSLLDHPHLVNLIGYCAEGAHRLLVYEFMFRGSLEQHLLDLPPNKVPLDWKTRMKIAEGAARGLGYLHEEADPPVIYRDFKASNILLNENFYPKLSDFGLAKLGPVGDERHVLTRVMGTYGYCAPEYAATGQLTTKSDVYSFGVVLLEIITGRRVIDNSRPSEEQNLVSWAHPMFKDKKKFQLMVDPKLDNNFPSKALYQALAIAAMCLQQEDDARPSMSDVVTALEYLSSNENRKGNDIEDEDALDGGGGENCKNKEAKAS